MCFSKRFSVALFFLTEPRHRLKMQGDIILIDTVTEYGRTVDLKNPYGQPVTQLALI